MNLDLISKPVMVVDESRCRANIARMAAKARRLGLHFRPHFKTHQSHGIGEWFRDEGVKAITVSSVEMALYFHRKRWKDVTLAIPVNPRESSLFFALSRMTALNLVITQAEALEPMLGHFTESHPGVFIKVDTGYGRAGLHYDDLEGIVNLAAELSATKNVVFKGILAHDGHAYQARTLEEIEHIRAQSNERLARVRNALLAAGFSHFVSAGDTPTCSRSDNWQGIDEIRPGNFAFYDMQQWVAGNCQIVDLAAAVYCPVIATDPIRGKAVLYGGAVHLSKDYVLEKGKVVYGMAFPVVDGEKPWPVDAEDIPFRLSGLSQEHGVISGSPDEIAQLKPGMLVAVFPAHSCLAARQFSRIVTTTGGEEQTMNS